MESRAMDELFERAVGAWVRYTALNGWPADQPSRAASSIEEVGGRSYVVLRNTRGVLALFRVKPNGGLRRLSRWPSYFRDEAIAAR